jgi:hypothetical protein
MKHETRQINLKRAWSGGLGKVWEADNNKSKETSRKCGNEDSLVVHRRLFNVITDNLYTQLNYRFENFHKL